MDAADSTLALKVLGEVDEEGAAAGDGHDATGGSQPFTLAAPGLYKAPLASRRGYCYKDCSLAMGLMLGLFEAGD